MTFSLNYEIVLELLCNSDKANFDTKNLINCENIIHTNRQLLLFVIE